MLLCDCHGVLGSFMQIAKQLLECPGECLECQGVVGNQWMATTFGKMAKCHFSQTFFLVMQHCFKINDLQGSQM